VTIDPHDPFQKFLGVPEASGPRAWLGLGGDETDAASIEAALRQRIAVTYAHRDGRREEAEQVRRRLRGAAETLLGSLKAPRRPARRAAPDGPVRRPFARLTDFDRHVLAVLIGCGGWNAATRSRLVALAASYGVSVEGLRKVVEGLSEYAKSGGARLGVAEITAGRTRVEAPLRGARARDESDLQWLAKVAPELMEPSAGSTFKLSLLFGTLTLLVGVVAVRILFMPAATGPGPTIERPPEATTPIDLGAAAVPRPPQPATPPQPVHRLAMFAQEPTFSGHVLTAESVSAADECPRLVAEIDTLARRITIADEPSEAVYRSWADCMQTIATGWVLIGDSVQESLGQAIFDALYAASDSPSVSDRLLEALIPPPWRVLEPIDVWRGAWMAGTLAQISHSKSLSPAVVDRARAQLDVALGGATANRKASFTDAAGAWLDRTVALLVEATEFNPQTYDLWESWIAAQRRLGRGERFEEAVMGAIGSILGSSADLARPGPSVNVLGRLLESADFESSSVVKDRIGELFADQDRVATRDLWVMTSLLARYDAAPWFSEDLVLAEDADWMFRRRTADRISRRWPEAATARPQPEVRVRGIPVDPKLAARWLALLQHQEEEDFAESTGRLLDQLIAACRLNEAASRIATGDADGAAPLLDLLESGGGQAGGPLPSPSVGPGAGRAVPRGRVGEPIGSDGEWAVRYEQTGHSAEERQEWLEDLSNSAGTDLGPIDAEVFVRVVYRGAPPEVRVLAQSILVEQFSTGPNVASEMLDQLMGVPSTEPISDTIGRLTRRLLPSHRSGSWRLEARLALVEHLLSLLDPVDVAVERQADEVVEAYDNRRLALQPEWSTSAGATTPHEAAEGLAEAWRQRAGAAWGEGGNGGSGVAELAELQRRHRTRLRLVSGPLHRFVAAQLAVLDLMALAAVTERPLLAEPAAAILAESGRRRSRGGHVLEQAVEAERAMGRLWRLQMAIGEQEGNGQ
jgi:hypothetical protein